MRFAVTLLLLIVLLGQQPRGQESLWKGREVFQEKGCVHCHSVYGEGGRVGPDFGYTNFYGTRFQLAASLWNHLPDMLRVMEQTGYRLPPLSQDEMKNLISYLAYIRYLGAPGKESRGRKLLSTKKCISCHKFGGIGGDLGPDIGSIKEYISPLRLAESMWNHGLQLMDVFQTRNIPWPIFYGNEFVDLSAGLRSFMSPTRVAPDAFDLGNPAEGESLASEKGCIRCHSFRGMGGTLGPDFAEVDLNYSVTQIASRMWNHGPPMWKMMKSEGVAFPVFEKGEMADVIAYIYGLKLEDAPGDGSVGERIVNERGCRSCHSLGSPEPASPLPRVRLESFETPEALIAAMWNHAPAMQEALAQKRRRWPQLSARDIADLYAYLHSLSKD